MLEILLLGWSVVWPILALGACVFVLLAIHTEAIDYGNTFAQVLVGIFWFIVLLYFIGCCLNVGTKQTKSKTVQQTMNDRPLPP